MKYSEEQIKKYLEILHNYTKNISDEPKMRPHVQIAKTLKISRYIKVTRFVKNVE